MTDEREGLPSASSFEQLDLCPGSHQAQAGLKDVNTKDAEHGEDIHNSLAGIKPPPEDYDKRVTYDKCKEWENSILTEWKEGLAVEEDDLLLEIREQRLWMFDGYIKIASGKFDVIYIHEESNSALCLDYKTLYGDHTEAPGNMQLRGGAVLAHLRYGVSNVTVGLIQPNAYPAVSTCTYILDDLRKAEKERRDKLHAARQPDALRIPGPKQCAFCKAAGTDRCPESKQVCTDVALVQQDQLAKRVTTEDMNLYYTAMPILKSMKARAEDQLREDPQSIPGYCIGKGRKTTTYDDPVAIFKAAQEKTGMSDDAFIACMKLGKTAFMEALREHTDLKGKELNALFNEITSGYVTVTQGDGSLEKEKL